MTRFIYSLLIVVLHASLTMAQMTKVETSEARQAISKATNDAGRVDSIISWNHKLFMSGNFTGAIQIIEEGIQLAESGSFTDQLVPLYMDLGRCYEIQLEDKTAIDYYRKAFQYLSPNSSEFTGKLYYYTGRSFQKLKEIDSMMHYYTKAEQWNEKHEPYRNWILYEAWHSTFVDHSDYDQALTYLLKAYAITKPVGKRMDHGMLLYRLRSVYDRMGNMAAYAKYTKEYQELVEASGGSTDMIHGFEQDKSLSNTAKITKYKALAKEFQAIDYQRAYVNTLSKLGGLYNDIGDYKNAKKTFLEVNQLKDKGSYKFNEDVYDNLHQISFKLGEYKEAYTYSLLQKEMKDSLLDEKKRVLLFNLEKKYESEKKEQELTLLSTENELKDLRIQEGKTLRNYLIAFTLGLCGVLLALYYSLLKNKESKRLLEEQNQIIEKNLAEKDVLLREIHHRVKNNLQVVSSLLSLQSNYISDDAALKAINEGKDRVSSMALIHQNLYKENDITGIETEYYFTELIDHLFDSYNIRENEISLVKEIDSIKLDVDTMIPLGLIANELISNALKHGFANSDSGTLSFKLKKKEDQLVMIVQDSGKGLEEKDFINSKSFGNKMITVFMQKLGAEMIITNEGGAHIEVIIKKFKLAA